MLRECANPWLLPGLGNEVLSIDHSNVLGCYFDLWRMASERENGHYQGIDMSANRNTTRVRVGVGNKDETVVADKAIAYAFSNRFHIPLNFELLETHMPFYQSALGDRLEMELTLNDYSRVILASGVSGAPANATYVVKNVNLEYDMGTQTDLARMIGNQYEGRFEILYNRVLLYRRVTKEKKGLPLELTHQGVRSEYGGVRGVLMLFEEPQSPFARDTQAFHNPKITNIEVSIEGKPNQLFSQGMHAYPVWDEARKFFAGCRGDKRHPEVAEVAKDLALADISLPSDDQIGPVA